MLDLKFIRENPDVVRAMLAARRMTAPLEELIEVRPQMARIIGGGRITQKSSEHGLKRDCTTQERQAGRLRADRRDENGVSED